MAKARSFSNMGSGWKGQSKRHSDAKRYGRAGGAYSKVAGKSRVKQGYDNVSYTKPIFKDGERVGTQFVTEKNKEPIVIGLSDKNSVSKRKNKKSRSRFDVMRDEMNKGMIEGSKKK